MRRRERREPTHVESPIMPILDRLGARLVGTERAAIYRVRHNVCAIVDHDRGGWTAFVPASWSALVPTVCDRVVGWAHASPLPWPARAPHPGFGGQANHRVVEGLPDGRVRIDNVIVTAAQADAMALELLTAADHARDYAARKDG